MIFESKMVTREQIARIGIFYDGSFFAHVNNYYRYNHERRSAISIWGLHEFIRHQVAKCEGSNIRHCQIVDMHYFRGRLRAAEAENRDLLYKERTFDDVLLQEGITTHYLPLSRGTEKGIDVWLALEMFELAVYQRFNVSVLIAADADFLPLVRKLNTLGNRVMVLGWDFKFIDQNGSEHETRTAQVLLDEVTYPVMMNPIIDRSNKTERLVNGLFLPRKQLLNNIGAAMENQNLKLPIFPAGIVTGKIQVLKNGFGFVTPKEPGDNLFFLHSDVENVDFNDLRIGDEVAYAIGKNERGPCARHVRLLTATTVK